ncbi:MAG: glycosyltransferase [bacterium]|nr:glycosyltransferase [bacterium]
MNNKTKKPTLAIGIPAYNEEHTILPLLKSLLSQHDKVFLLKEIIVASDGSTDHTVSRASSTGDARVTVLHDRDRLGKPARINQIFNHINTDIVVLFDADIDVHSQNLLEELLTPMIHNITTQAVFGSADILPPKNLIQKIVTVGWDMWEDLKKNTPNAELYNCQGTIRAFRRELYKTMRFPNASADDAFPFLYCKKHNHRIAFAPNATVFYSQPSSYIDYVKQMIRFHGSERIQQQNFDKGFVSQFYVIKTHHRLKTLLRFWVKNPIEVLAYVLFLVIPKTVSLFHVREAMTPLWNIAVSTKKH